MSAIVVNLLAPFENLRKRFPRVTKPNRALLRIGGRDRAGRRCLRRSARAVASPHVGEHVCPIVDAPDRRGQAILGADRDGRRRGDRGRHEHDGRVEPQERDAEEASANRRLDERSFRQASSFVEGGRQYCSTRCSPRTSCAFRFHELVSVRRRNEEIAALAAVSAAAPPAMSAAFRSVSPCSPRAAATELARASRSSSGLLFV
jgi:hypothetical protein